MLNWNKIRYTIFFTLLISLATSPIYACGDYDYDCGYDGMYDVGGYNLYSFGADMYPILSYDYSGYDYGYNYGGSCGSFSSYCGSCYDTTYLTDSYLPSNSYSSSNTQLINQLLISQINNNSLQLCLTFGICNSGTSINPNGIPGINPTMPISPYPPTTQFPPMGFPPGMTPIDPGFYPPITQMPPPGVIPFSPPPPTTIPYGGCDNIIVMCPQGPINRPLPIPGVPNLPPYNPGTPGGVTPGTTPSYPPGYTNTGTVDQAPNRYRVPRGAVNRTH